MFEPCPKQYDDNEFESIDLNDDIDICEICNQATSEPIERVILSDEFTLFEGSYSKHAGGVTKAHQHCLTKWADIIERSIQSRSNSRSSSPSLKDSSGHDSSDDGDDKSTENRDNTQYIKKDKTFEKGEKRYTLAQLNGLSVSEIMDIIGTLKNTISENSVELVEQLKLKDRILQEISAQKSHIEQIVLLERKSSIKNSAVK